MALLKAEARVCQPAEVYAAKKRKIFAEVNAATERISGEMIYCLKCYQPKVFDDPTRPFIVKCKCECEIAAMERSFYPRRYQWMKNGDYNPFDQNNGEKL